MFLTRLGFGSKAVVTGDITQIDLPAGRMSGLVEAISVVGQVEGVAGRRDRRTIPPRVPPLRHPTSHGPSSTPTRRRRSPRQAGASPLHPCPVPVSLHCRRPREPLRRQPEPTRERRPEARRTAGAARAAEEEESWDRRIRLPRTTPGRPGGRTASATRPHRCHPQLPPRRPLRPSHPSRPYA